MIENKRFIYTKSEGEIGYAIYDTTKNYTEKNYTFPNFPREYEAKVLCRVLNELHEENEKLTKQLMDSKILVNDLSMQRDEFFNGAIENAELNGKLQKENEQLQRYVHHCPQICERILTYLKKCGSENVRAVNKAMDNNEYFDEEVDTL